MHLSASQRAFLRRDGYLLLPAYSDSESTDLILSSIKALIAHKSLRAFNTQAFYDAHRAVNNTFDNPHLSSESLAEFAVGLSVVAEQVIDKPKFHMSLIQHNESNKSHSIPWHQDLDCSVGSEVFYNFLFYPHDCDELLGGLRLVPGSHHEGPITTGGSHDELAGEITIYPKAGDLLIVDGLTYHAVPENRSKRDRTSFCIRYIAERIVGNAALNIGRYRTGSYNYAEQKDVHHA